MLLFMSECPIDKKSALVQFMFWALNMQYSLSGTLLYIDHKSASKSSMTDNGIIEKHHTTRE